MGRTTITAAINGNRPPTASPYVPVTEDRLAIAVRDSLSAGADYIHFHPRQSDGTESIDPLTVAGAIRAIRELSPDAIVGTTTGLWTCGDSHRERLRAVTGWLPGARPDFASVAYAEEGADETATALLTAGIAVESAVWSLDHVPVLLRAASVHSHVRVLIEPEDATADAIDHARRMARALREGGYRGPLQYHGFDATAWPVLEAAIADGHEIRVGIEDSLTLPSGEIADNVALVTFAAALAAERI